MAVKKKKKKKKRSNETPKHQLMTTNLGGDCSVFLSSFQPSPGFRLLWTWGKDLQKEREQDRTERVWLYFCLLMCFCFSEGEFKGLGSFAGLWAASHFFSSLALFQPTNV